jgi:hypothetical protein
MSRQSRLIVIMAAMALIAVIVLALVAERYSKLIDSREGGPRQTGEQAAGVAAAQVDAFIRVRLALRESIDAGTFVDVRPDARALAFGALRSRVLSGARVHEADYRELRRHFRRWKRDPASLDGVWNEAFENRREELAGCDLGESESLDR